MDVSLAAGTHTLAVTSTQNRGPNLDQLRVAASGPAAPALAFDDDALSFSVDENSGLSAVQLLGLGTSDGSVATASLSAQDSWLKVSPADGSTPLTGIEVRVDASGLAPGSYTSNLSASASGFTSDSVTVTLRVNGSGPPPGGDDTIYETESAALSGVTVRSSYDGFTGTGYGDFRGAASATWTIAVPADGLYTLAFRYAVGIKDRKAVVSIDGASVAAVTSLPSTGAWTTWAEMEFEQDLTAGSHTGPSFDIPEPRAQCGSPASDRRKRRGHASVARCQSGLAVLQRCRGRQRVGAESPEHFRQRRRFAADYTDAQPVLGSAGSVVGTRTAQRGGRADRPGWACDRRTLRNDSGRGPWIHGGDGHDPGNGDRQSPGGL